MQTSFSVSPTSQNLTLDPGQVFTGTILIGNNAEATEDLHYQISVVPYNVSGEDYVIDTTTVQNYSQIADWITIAEPTGTLAPNETRRVEFTITVPQTAPGGAQSAALIISPETSSQSDGGVAVSNIFQMASIVYANVTGETIKSGEILSNNVPAFSLVNPVSVSALFSNTGNVYQPATIRLSATNVFTGESLIADGAGSYSEIILPETTRYIQREISDLPPVGVVHLEQEISYLDQISVATHDLFIVPLWFMALVILVIAGVVTGIVVAVRHHRRKKLL